MLKVFSSTNPSIPPGTFKTPVFKLTVGELSFDNLREEKQNIWLEKLINLAEEKNQNVHIVLSPATKEYKACLPNSSELFKDLYNVNGPEKATLINLYDSEMFDSEDFGDLDHLNSKGAEKLSNYVRNLIMK